MDEYLFSKPVLRHLLHAVDGISSHGFTEKLTEIHATSHHPKHRTTLGHFLQHSPWEESYLLREMKQHVHGQLSKNEPAFLIIDDTISKKTKPSSRATSPTEACGFHFSHTEGKNESEIISKLENTAFISMVKNEFNKRIGGNWNINSKGKVNNWYRETYEIRNKIIHAGYVPKIEEVSIAIDRPMN